MGEKSAGYLESRASHSARDIVYVCVCVCVRERERERESACLWYLCVMIEIVTFRWSSLFLAFCFWRHNINATNVITVCDICDIHMIEFVTFRCSSLYYGNHEVRRVCVII